MDKYCLIGEKLSHSYSAHIHKEFGYSYELCSVAKNALKDFVSQNPYKGFNVTIPYKEDIIPLLDDIDDSAKSVGAVNTVIRRGDNLIGFNTDVMGFIYLLDNANINVSGKKVLILGSGGTAKTVKAVMKIKGARDVITISRTGKNNYDNIKLHFDSEVIINTTPVGMYPNNGDRIVELELFNSLYAVIDAIYNPYYTALLLDAKRLGIKHANGLKMLVAQAKYARDIFLSHNINDNIIEKIHKKLMLDTLNIVLIGMPSSGKSSVAKELSKRLNKPLVDIDSEIEKQETRTIATIFNTSGESYFRQLESQNIAKFGKEKGQIIAVGGGGVMAKNAYENLKQNGILVLLERHPDKVDTTGRPLLQDTHAWAKLYQKRQSTYLAFADVMVDNNGSIADTTDNVLEKIYEYINH